MNVKVGPAGFFNMAAPEAGINASYTKTTTEQQTTEGDTFTGVPAC